MNCLLKNNFLIFLHYSGETLAVFLYCELGSIDLDGNILIVRVLIKWWEQDSWKKSLFENSNPIFCTSLNTVFFFVQVVRSFNEHCD